MKNTYLMICKRGYFHEIVFEGKIMYKREEHNFLMIALKKRTIKLYTYVSNVHFTRQNVPQTQRYCIVIFDGRIF